MAINSEAGLDGKFIEFAQLMNNYLSHFPNHEKFGLALDIRRAAYDTYALIVECQKRYQKKTSLTNLDIRHEQLRMLVRLAYELKYFWFKEGKMLQDKGRAEHRYLNISLLIDELGRIIGSWIGADRSKSALREAS